MSVSSRLPVGEAERTFYPNGTLNSGSLMIYLQSFNRQDDVLQVNRLKSGGYRAIFKNYTVGRVFEQYFEDYDSLLQYLDTFILIQQVDTQPYAFIQIDLPGMPTVVMRPQKSEWNSVYQLVKQYLENISQDSYTWPREYSLDAFRQRTSARTLNVD
jgi:hypothetical protein